jgi:hypothetical protein
MPVRQPRNRKHASTMASAEMPARTPHRFSHYARLVGVLLDLNTGGQLRALLQLPAQRMAQVKHVGLGLRRDMASTGTPLVADGGETGWVFKA